MTFLYLCQPILVFMTLNPCIQVLLDRCHFVLVTLLRKECTGMNIECVRICSLKSFSI